MIENYLGDNRDLFYRFWKAEDENDVFLISHGLGEHSGRYQWLADFLNAQGISVYAFDHYGHGKSYGVQGHIDHFDQYAESLNQFSKMIQELHHISPIILGHSLGAVIAHYSLIRNKDICRGLILSSPGYEKKVKPPLFKVLASKILYRIVPKIKINNEIDPADISRDQDVVKKYIEDPLVHPYVSPKFFISFLDAIKTIKTQFHLNVPVLVVLAGNDRIVSADECKSIWSKIESDKEIIEYPKLYHEILNEQQRFDVYEDIIKWKKTKFPK